MGCYEHAELAAAQRALSRMVPGTNDRGYCVRAEDNLVETLTAERWARAQANLDSGKGSELSSKFLAAYSSSALAVNAFGPLDGRVLLPGEPPITGEISFEQERSAGVRGFKPTLDVVVESPASEVKLFVESKCIEYLRKGITAFSTAFVRKAREMLSPEAAAAYEAVAADPCDFDPLDAPQLLKHFLAAKRVAGNQDRPCRVVLVCVWWEPSDAAAYPVFGAHSRAAARLARSVPDPDVTLVTMTYPELWAHWEEHGDEALRHHVEVLRRRYAVLLAG